MECRLIVSDLDGTLLNENHGITKETIAALQEAQHAGIRLLIATGRSWKTAYPLLKNGGIVCDYVLLNGAEFRNSMGELIYDESIPVKDAQNIVQLLQQKRINFEINTEKGDYSTDIELCSTAQLFSDQVDFWKTSPVIRKIFIFSNDAVKLHDMKQCCKKWSTLSVTSSKEWNLELTSLKAKKGIMVQRAAQYYGISNEQVCVFGDGENDQSMFQIFPHSRAMKNAVVSIQNIAEKVIDSHTENGVAKEIRKSILSF